MAWCLTKLSTKPGMPHPDPTYVMSLYWGGRHPQDFYMHELATKWAADLAK